jgi:SulP family sulfate permease
MPPSPAFPCSYGLYTAFVALIAYAIFGTSRQMVQGPSGAVAAVSAAVVGPIVGIEALGTDKAIGYTAALALGAGVIYILLGLLRMGWISSFLSKAVLGGFVLGFAIGIIIDQSQKLLGIDKVSGTYVEELIGISKALPDTNLATLAVGTASLAALLLMRHFLSTWPRALIVMALSILAVQAFDLVGEGVAVTGPVPTGLFSIGLPGWDGARPAPCSPGRCRWCSSAIRSRWPRPGPWPSSIATRSTPTRS